MGIQFGVGGGEGGVPGEGGPGGRTPREVEDALTANTPPEYRKDAHHWLLLHGRYVCKARSPACPKCIIRDLCEYPHKTPARASPAKPMRPMRPVRRRRAPR